MAISFMEAGTDLFLKKRREGAEEVASYPLPVSRERQNTAEASSSKPQAPSKYKIQPKAKYKYSCKLFAESMSFN